MLFSDLNLGGLQSLQALQVFNFRSASMTQDKVVEVEGGQERLLKRLVDCLVAQDAPR